MDYPITWVIIFAGIVGRILRLWMVEEDPVSISETPGKNIYKWVSIFIVISIFVIIFSFEFTYLNYIVFTYVTVFLLFRAFMEWKYIREEREHIVSLVELGVQSICFLIFVF